jgi:hypothetical protein
MLKLTLVTLLVFLSLSFVAAQDYDAEKMALMMELAKPGPEHQMLEKMTGTWEQDIKIWMKPGAEPMLMNGKSVNEMILGGRFLKSNVSGGEGEMKMEGLSIMGFDRRHQKFTTVGFDTWGTYYITAAGPYDEETKSIIMYGEDEEVTMGVTQKYDIIVRFVDDNTYVSEVVFKEMVEVTSKRVK